MKKCLTLLLLLVLMAARSRAQSVDDFQARTYTDSNGRVLPYRLFVPKNYDPAKKYPLVLYYHGAGERGTDNRNQLAGQPAPMIFARPDNQANYPVFMVAPQCPADQQWVDMPFGAASGVQPATPTWPLAASIQVLDNLKAEFTGIDASRIIVTGISMGGYGTWDALIRWPDKFQKAVPICGGGDESKVGPIVNKPIWAFHSADDGVVPVGRSRNMVGAIRSLGGTPKYTEYCANGLPCYGHFSWNPAYADPELLPWLFGAPIPGVYGGDGLRGDYYPNMERTGAPALTRIDPVIDFNWGFVSPDASLIPEERFGVHWSGQILAPKSETYTFSWEVDDYISLRINGQPYTAPIALNAGQKYTIDIAYTEVGGAAYCRLFWSSATTPLEIIPKDNLFSAPSTSPTNIPPTVALTAPAANASVAVGTAITLTATAADSDGSIARVEFYQGTTKLGESTASPYSLTWTPAAAGSYALTARATDNQGATTTSAPVALTATAAPNPTPGAGTGLAAAYYNTRDLSGPAALQRTDATVDFDWGAGAPAPAVSTDNFSARWNGQVLAPVSGSYTFATVSDDGVRLWVNGQLLVDNWTDHGPTTDTGTLTLVAGQKYDLRLEYYENGGGAVCRLQWSYPGQVLLAVPQGQLFPVVTLPNPEPVAGLSGTYRLLARHSGKALDVSDASTADGARAIQRTVSGGASQLWKVEATDGGYYKLTAQHSGKCLDVSAASVDIGAPVQQHAYGGGANQQWKIEATSDGYYKLTARHSGKALDVDGVSTADGARVHQWNYVGGLNQQWKLEQVAPAGAQTLATGANLAALETGLQIYPNPNRGGGPAALAFSPARAQRVGITVHNQLGQLVRTLSVAAQAGPNDVALPPLAPGLYLLRATIDGQPQHATLQVQ